MDQAAYRVNVTSGLISGARQVISPHCDDRPPNADIEMLVIHGISLPPGQFGGTGVEDFFLGRLQAEDHPYFASIAAQRVSAHLFIRRDGEVLQFVPFHRRAWHAGVSSFDGRVACNDFSIGVELEGCDDIPYSSHQYAALGPIARALMQVYPGIIPTRIVGHSDIAPGRKTDPGAAFDWRKFRSLLG
jgi:N-acetyl-anhydromuramoyl-L-alanine amidase